MPGGGIEARAKALTKEVGRSPKHIYTSANHGFSFRGSGWPLPDSQPRQVSPGRQNQPGLVDRQSTPSGIRRIDARHPSAADAHDSGFRGAGVSIAILDTASTWIIPSRCQYRRRAWQELHGRRTTRRWARARIARRRHADGVADNGIGIVGVAPSARIVPIKVLDDTGNGTTATVVCGIDHLVPFGRTATRRTTCLSPT